MFGGPGRPGRIRPVCIKPACQAGLLKPGLLKEQRVTTKRNEAEAMDEERRRATYQALTKKVDDFFARTWERHAEQMACQSGCHDCCLVHLSVTPVEAELIRSLLPQLPRAIQSELLARAHNPLPDRCVCLDAKGRCSIYAARPLVCRSHGAPIRLPSSASSSSESQRGAGPSLPVVTACHRNFTEHGPQAADSDCILDQETLSALLLAVNAVGMDGEVDVVPRRPLAQVVAEALEGISD